MLMDMPAVIQAGTLEERLESYQSEGAGPFAVEQGGVVWQRKVRHVKSVQLRSCADCHGKDLRKSGRHVKTGKVIEPMAPSVNAQRLSDGKKIEKWFKRNCKWTWGRVCTAQEKGNIPRYLQQQ
jgi:hypothetical protein